jgi:transketolase
VLLGDGETNEGSNWEAAMSAAAWKLDTLIAIPDRNRLCVAGPTEEIMPIEPLFDKWTAFGFETVAADGHDLEELIGTITALRNKKNGKPKMLIANTVKGKGVSFMENERTWHGHPIDDAQYALAMAELGGGVKK